MVSGKIRVLDESVIARIAAAESVSRPAAVVKELVENSLDAGASRVDVTLSGAGKSLILVADDGEGMGAEDIILSARRHATSKIRTAEDLMSAATLGFRGEALASVAAVADLLIRSGRDGQGHEVRFPAETARPAPFTQGTRVEVRNLFKAVPARLSFLRPDRAEVLAVMEAVRGLALMRPDVSFTLSSDERLTLDLRAAGPGERLAQILGRPFAEAALPASLDQGGIRVEGWVCPPPLTKGAASDQFLFVNGRQVRAASAGPAARAGYGAALPASKHPGFVLFLTLPPGAVDINAHPNKAEVRFRDPPAVATAIEAAVSSALSAQAAPPRRPQDATAEAVSAPATGPLIIGEWELFASPDGPAAVNRAEVIRAILRGSAPEDCLPVITRASALAGEAALRRSGVCLSAFGGEAALSAVPSGVPGDPVRLAALLGEARGAAAMEAAVSLWATEALAGDSLADHPAATRRPINAEAFSRMMGRAR